MFIFLSDIYNTKGQRLGVHCIIAGKSGYRHAKYVEDIRSMREGGVYNQAADVLKVLILNEELHDVSVCKAK
jgi:hypothetical protein